MAIDIATCQTEESKLAWAFKLYDLVTDSLTICSITSALPYTTLNMFYGYINRLAGFVKFSYLPFVIIVRPRPGKLTFNSKIKGLHLQPNGDAFIKIRRIYKRWL